MARNLRDLVSSGKKVCVVRDKYLASILENTYSAVGSWETIWRNKSIYFSYLQSPVFFSNNPLPDTTRNWILWQLSLVSYYLDNISIFLVQIETENNFFHIQRKKKAPLLLFLYLITCARVKIFLSKKQISDKDNTLRFYEKK